MQLLKFGTRYKKVGVIAYGVPDLVPAEPGDTGPLYVRADEVVDRQLVALALKYLDEYHYHLELRRDALRAADLDRLIEQIKGEMK